MPKTGRTRVACTYWGPLVWAGLFSEPSTRSWWPHHHSAIACQGGSSPDRDKKILNKLQRAGSVLGYGLDSIEEVADRRMLARLISIRSNSIHPLQHTLEVLVSSFSTRLRDPQSRKEQRRRSFLPIDIRVFNVVSSLSHNQSTKSAFIMSNNLLIGNSHSHTAPYCKYMGLAMYSFCFDFICYIFSVKYIFTFLLLFWSVCCSWDTEIFPLHNNNMNSVFLFFIFGWTAHYSYMYV